MDFGESLARFRALRPSFERLQGTDLSEADTRANIVDRLLVDVLGWDPTTAVRRERHVTFNDGTQGYIDYFCESESNKIIVEAKRTGTYFEMPKVKYRRTSLKSLTKRAPALAEALSQVTGYCKEHLVHVGVVCNGLQIAITYLPNHLKVGSFDTLLFDGADDIETQFLSLYNTLSPYGNAGPILEHLLGGRGDIRPTPQYRRRIVSELPEEGADRNPIDHFLQPLTQEFFADLSDEMLDECFVETGRQTRYQAQFERLLLDQTPRVGLPVTEITGGKGSTGVFQADYEAMTRMKTGVVFLLLGGVGVGKTHFIRRFFTRLMDEPNRKRTIWLHVDCTKASDETPNLLEFALKEMLSQIGDRYGEIGLEKWETLLRVYSKEIEKHRDGIWAPIYRQDPNAFDLRISELISDLSTSKMDHIGALLKYAREQLNFATCVVFDNADQLGAEFQKRMVMLAFQLAKAFGGLVLLVLREETYWRLKASGPFDAYANRVYHITPPRVADVLTKRLEAVKRLRDGEKVKLSSRSGISLADVSTSDFADAVIKSLYYRGNTDLDPRSMILFEALAAGNVRLALELFRTFLTSGHTDTDEYLQVLITKGSYTIPERAFFRSVALGDRRHFNSDRSLIVNLFTIEDDGFFSHFTKLRILDFISSRIGVESQAGMGYVKVRSLCEQLSELARDEESLRSSLTPLLRRLLVEADNGLGLRLSGRDVDYIRLTSAGWYYLTHLSRQFHYLDLVCTDTPITNPDYYSQLRILSDTERRAVDKPTRLRARLDRTKVFLEYLMACEDKEELYTPQAAQRTYGSSWARQVFGSWPAVANDIWSQAQRSYGKHSV